jgi:hypothetical protein
LFQISQVLHKNLTRLKDNYFQKRERRANLAGQHLKLQNGEVCTQRQKKKEKEKRAAARFRANLHDFFKICGLLRANLL